MWKCTPECFDAHIKLIDKVIGPDLLTFLTWVVSISKTMTARAVKLSMIIGYAWKHEHKGILAYNFMGTQSYFP